MQGFYGQRESKGRRCFGPAQNSAGFTIIEMIVSLALFAVVVTISVGSLLVLVGTSDRLQVEQSIMTNLSFALDSMSREIRTGSYYYCGSNNESLERNIFTADVDTLQSDAARDCPDGMNSNATLHGLAFKEAGDSITGTDDRILYYYDSISDQILRRVGGGQPEPIVSDEMAIIDADIIVTDSAPLISGVGEVTQPTVTIFIEAVSRKDPSGKSYFVQTTVTQRTLDI